MFTPEGFEHVDNKFEGGSDKGGEEKKGERLLEEELSDAENGGNKGSKDDGKFKDYNQSATKEQRS